MMFKIATFKRSILITCLSALATLVFLFNSSLNTEAAATNGKAHFSIDFVGNLLLNKYDVDFFVDNEKISTLKHGVDYSTTLDLDAGSHRLIFTKAGDPSISVSGTFNTSTESTISCKISVDKKSIKLSDFTSRDDAAAKAKEAREKAAAKEKAEKEEKEKQLKESVRLLCAVESNNDEKIQTILKDLSDQIFIISGYVAYVTETKGTDLILVRVGKYANNEISGPDFQIKCENLSELPYNSNNNLEIKPGLSIDIEGSVGEYDDKTNMIELLPTKITGKGTNYEEKRPINLTAQSTIKSVQAALNESGYDCGTPDGKAGKRTYAAIEQYKKDRGLSSNYTIDDELAEYLRIIPTEGEVVGAATGVIVASGESEQKADNARDYVLNTNKHKFHRPDCRYIDQMNEENKWKVHKTREEVLALGYSPCGHCKP